MTRFQPGEDVFGTCNGSFAEYGCAKEDDLAPRPANLSFELAAAVPISGITALEAVRDKAEVQAGQRILIIGAGGGVGTFAVQLAKAFGAEVTGVCSTTKTDFVRSIGAEHAIDYTREDFVDRPQRYDAIVDIAGNRSLSHLRRALAPKGTLVIVGSEEGGRWFAGIGRQLRASMLSPFISQRLRWFISRGRLEDLETLRELIEAGKVTPVVDRTFPLSEAAEAIRYLRERRARGKVVVTV